MTPFIRRTFLVAIATVPIANASGAAGPVACTISVILKAAVTVGEMTDSDSAMASGRFRRDTRLVMSPHHVTSPHHEGRHIGVGHQALRDIGHRTIESLIAAKAHVLALEMGKTLLLDKDTLVKEANAAQLTISGLQL